MGDPKRLYIGGVHSLYRVKSYSGAWEDDRQQGIGVHGNTEKPIVSLTNYCAQARRRYLTTIKS